MKGETDSYKTVFELSQHIAYSHVKVVHLVLGKSILALNMGSTTIAISLSLKVKSSSYVPQMDTFLNCITLSSSFRTHARRKEKKKTPV